MKAGPKPPDVMDQHNNSLVPAAAAGGDLESQYRTMQRALERQHRLYDRMLTELKATQR
jgi:hypothetical protein